MLNGMAVTATGNIVLTGSFDGAGLSFGGVTHHVVSGRQMYVTKLAGTNGGLVWSKAFPAKNSSGNGIAVNAAGDAYVAATVNTSIDFQDGTVLTVPTPAADSQDAVFMRLSGSSGGRLWGKIVGTSTSQESATCVSVDTQGQPIFAGYFTVLMDFGNGKIIYNNNTNPCVFLVKLSSSIGAVQWAAAANNSSTAASATPVALATDGRDNAIVVGNFPGRVTFGSKTLLCDDQQDGFIAKYSNTGGVAWATKFGGGKRSNVVNIFGVATSPDTDVVVIGSFLGFVELYKSSKTSHSSYDMFLSKIGSQFPPGAGTEGS